jgi:hypothetical protein
VERFIDYLFPISTALLNLCEQDLIFLWRPFTAIETWVQKVLPAFGAFFAQVRQSVSNRVT